MNAVRVGVTGLAMLALVAVPGAWAAVNDPMPFDIDVPFSSGFGDDAGTTLASGRLEAEVHSDSNGYGFLGAEGFSVRGLSQVCWVVDERGPSDDDGCRTSPAAGLSVTMLDGGSTAFRHPSPTMGRYASDFSLVFFVDYAGGGPEEIDLGQGILAPSLNGVFEFLSLPAARFDRLDETQGAIVLEPLDEGTVYHIRDGEALVGELYGQDAPTISLWGDAEAPWFATDMVALPFLEGSTARLTPAPDDVAARGLDLTRLDSTFSDTPEGSPEQEEVEGGLPIDGPLAGIFGTVLLNAPGEEAGFDELTLIRHQGMRVTHEDQGLHARGEAPLQVQEGHVVGADPLVGFLPWWAILLWAVAIAGVVARIVLHPSKRNKAWDRFRLVGLIGAPLAGILAFVLWDSEVYALWGTSLLHSGPAALPFLVVVEFLPLLLVMLGLAIPIHLCIGHLTRFTGQGTFMGAAWILTPMIAYALGASLMLDYLDSVVGLLADQF